MKREEWFADWFDTPYYHILYRHRNDTEAQQFIAGLMQYVNMAPGKKVLDLACGKGRHSIYLNSLGFDVTGMDLSANSIAEAQQHANDTLHFKVHDMRAPFGSETFDCVFNLFTSFGYFADDAEDMKVIENVYNSLVPGGYFVFDYFNAQMVKQADFTPYVQESGGIKFTISKQLQGQYIVKNITVNDQGTEHHYHEKVKLIEREWMEQALVNAGFVIEHLFGSYRFQPYNSGAERLIIIARKK